jgi:Ca-activated chloride channel family protein
VRGRRGAIAILAAGACSLGWLDPSATPRAAARFYAEGKFDDAATKYNQALTDDPDSALLHFNLGDAEYRRQKYEEAARAFAQTPEDPAAGYNLGNALFKLGEAAAEEKPQDALGKWAEALVAYRRAIATDPSDEDAKFNYEWVSRKIDELKKKLEEQQKNQDQQQQQQRQQQQQDQQKSDEQKQQRQDGQPQPDEQEQAQQQQEQQAEEKKEEQGEQPQGQQQAQQPAEPGQQGGREPQQAEAQAGEVQPPEGELSREEATALLDGERNEELRPDEVIRRQLGTGEAPVQDW